MPRTITAIFAHPDDEVLGCGASLARHADAGDRVRVLILATGVTSRGGGGGGGSGNAIAALRDQAHQAGKILGVGDIAFGEFPDNRMDSVPLLAVVHEVEAFFDGSPPDIVYTHHAGDLNIDHRITHQAVLTALRPQPGRSPHEIRSCEVNSATEWSGPSLPSFEPTVFEDVSAVLERKLAALRCYGGEVRDWPHPRSVKGVEALARWRGAQCGRTAAEAFMLVRRVGAA